MSPEEKVVFLCVATEKYLVEQLDLAIIRFQCSLPDKKQIKTVELADGFADGQLTLHTCFKRQRLVRNVTGRKVGGLMEMNFKGIPGQSGSPGLNTDGKLATLICFGDDKATYGPALNKQLVADIIAKRTF